MKSLHSFICHYLFISRRPLGLVLSPRRAGLGRWCVPCKAAQNFFLYVYVCVCVEQGIDVIEQGRFTSNSSSVYMRMTTAAFESTLVVVVALDAISFSGP